MASSSIPTAYGSARVRGQPASQSSSSTQDRLRQLEEEASVTRLELARKQGHQVWLRDDERYAPLHDDLTVSIVAEGTIRIGPPHLLTFTYDNHTPTHVHVKQQVTSKKTTQKNDDYRDMSDSDESSSESLTSDDEETYEIVDRVKIPAEHISYPLDLPSDARRGKSYAFFVIAPEE